MSRRLSLLAAVAAAVAVAAVLLVVGGTRSSTDSGAAGRTVAQSPQHAGPDYHAIAVRRPATAAELRRAGATGHFSLLFLIPGVAALAALATWSIARCRRVASPLLLAGSCRSRAPPTPA